MYIAKIVKKNIFANQKCPNMYVWYRKWIFNALWLHVAMQAAKQNIDTKIGEQHYHEYSNAIYVK